MQDNPSFKEKVVNSSKWAIINQAVTQGIRILVSIYLMRILDPESFGVFMKVLAIVGISEVLVGLRLGGGIIQTKNLNNKQLSTIFWFTIFTSVILASILYLSAGLVAKFYIDHRLTNVTRLTSLVIIVIGFGYVSRSLLTKSLEFKKIFIANLIGIILSSIIGIWLAINGYGYWSLAWQWSSYNISISIIYFLYARINLGLYFDIKEIKRMWSFSSKIAMNDSLNYFVRNVDNIIVGRILGSISLGLYSRAYGLMLLPLQNFVNIINGVLFPSLSTIQNEIMQVRRMFIRALQTASAFVTPTLLYILFFEQELLNLFVGSNWNGILTILKIFLVLAIIQSHTTLSISVFYSTGNATLPLKLSFFSKPLLIITFLLVTPYGLEYLALAITVISGTFGLIQLFLALRVCEINWETLFAEFRVLVVIHIITILILILLKFLLGSLQSNLYTILISSLVLAVYLIIVYESIKPQFYKSLKKVILSSKVLD